MAKQEKNWYVITIKYSSKKMDKIYRTDEYEAKSLKIMYEQLYPKAIIKLETEKA